VIPLLTAEEMRGLDRATVDRGAIPGAVLMETAGRGAFHALWSHFGELARSRPTAVLCGRGNNGGDGFVVARCLSNRGCSVTAYLLGPSEGVRGEAAVHLRAFVAGGGSLVEVDAASRKAVASEVETAGLLVDAILGTGLSESVRGLAAEAISWINASPAPVVSLDVPSGISSDTGRVCGAAVAADLTVSFGFPKRGHYLYPGASLTGRLETVDIGIPPRLAAELSPSLLLAESSDFCCALERPPEAHKGTFGHVLVFGGAFGKEGAPGLAATAALRAGAGLATVAWPAAVGRIAAARLPLALMTLPLPTGESAEQSWSEALWEDAEHAGARADAIVVGPGMGTDDGARGFLARLLSATTRPLVLDADALNLMALHPDLLPQRSRTACLTPHPGEAARLLGTTIRHVQEDRIGAARQLAESFHAVIILKGAHSLVTAPKSPTYLVCEGNPGMATAGAGDVLSGVVAALLARGLPPLDAARLAAYVHASAGDLAARELGQEGMTAEDLLCRLPSSFSNLKGCVGRGCRR
jgi:ADP-dependent NAD(P)H-hydrate dehydratase / NAD(P)H-hydrate epimerase